MMTLEVEKVSRWVPNDPRRHRNGGRTKAMYEARLGDMTETAPTAAAAKAGLLERAAKALTGRQTPSLLRHAGWTAIVWRNDVDWSYALIAPDFEGIKMLWGTSGHATAEEAEQHARRHLAQNLFTHENPLAGLELISDPEDRRQYLRDATWQVRYRALADADYDGRLHETAGGMDAWPDDIAKPADLTDPDQEQPQ